MALLVFLISLGVISCYQYIGVFFNLAIGGFDTKKEFLYWLIPVYPSVKMVLRWFVGIPLYFMARWKALK